MGQVTTSWNTVGQLVCDLTYIGRTVNQVIYVV